MNLKTLRRTAAELTAAAVHELFPDIGLLGGGETTLGFTYDFRFPHPVNPETLLLIEEKMRQIIREQRPIRTLDMVPFSAAELLKRDGHALRAEGLEGEDLVEIIQIGSFHDLSLGPHLKNTAELGAFKLLRLEKINKSEIRIIGSAHFSKEELKEFLKKLAQYKGHLQIGKEKGFWVEWDGGIVWKEAGLGFRQRLIEVLKKNCCAGLQEISGPLDVERGALYREMEKKFFGRVYEMCSMPNEKWDPELGLFEPEMENRIQIPAFQEGELISSLQSIGKTLNILGFSYCLRLLGRKRGERGLERLALALDALKWKAETEIGGGEASRIEFEIEDAVGRFWPAAQCGAEWAHISVEKILALLLERFPDENLNKPKG